MSLQPSQSSQVCPPCPLCQAGDEHVVLQTKDWRVIVVDDAHYPGFCRVIWQDHVREMSDLSAQDRLRLMDVVFAVESAVQSIFKPDKINLASLGNVVPHLHWHIIPRYANDRHFPNPIWGEAQREIAPELLAQRQALTPSLLAEIRRRLSQN